jgi:hypothetical protein
MVGQRPQGADVTSDVWTIVIGITGLAVNGVGLSFLAVQVSMARKNAAKAAAAEVEERHRRKQQATLDYISATFEMRGALWSALPDDFDPRAVAEFCEQAKSDMAATRLIRSYLSHLEVFAVGISGGIYDLVMADSVFGSRVMAVQAAYGPFINHRRTATGSGSLMQEFEWLAGRISDIRAERPAYVPLARRALEPRKDGSSHTPSTHAS